MNLTLGQEVGEMIDTFLNVPPGVVKIEGTVGTHKVSVYRVGKSLRVDIHPTEETNA